MRSFLVAMAVVLTAAIFAAPAGAATDRASCPSSLERSYSKHYKKVAKMHSKRAPGRNIRKYGVLFKGNVFDATCGELRRSLKQLKKLEVRRQYIAISDVPPAQPPAGVRSVGMAPSGLAACIVHHESGGNPQAVNPNGHYGIGQWDHATWRAHGGTKYAPTPLGASYNQQLLVLNNALARYGCSAWCPYDGC